MKIELTKDEWQILRALLVREIYYSWASNDIIKLEKSISEKLGEEWTESNFEYQRCDYCYAYPKLKPFKSTEDEREEDV